MKRYFSAWQRATARQSIAVLCTLLNWSVAGHAQDASASSSAASAVPTSLRGTWLGEEVNSKQGRDWVAVIVHDDGEIDWYDDLPTKEAPVGTGGRKRTQVKSISDNHLTVSYQVSARNGRLRNQTVVSTIVLDLKDGLLVGHREFPLDPDRSVTLTRAEPAR